MPNIRSQALTANGLTIVASNGRSITVTKEDIRARFLIETGTNAQRQTKTITWFKSQIETALGAEQVPTAAITADVNTATGSPTNFEVSV